MQKMQKNAKKKLGKNKNKKKSQIKGENNEV